MKHFIIILCFFLFFGSGVAFAGGSRSKPPRDTITPSSVTPAPEEGSADNGFIPEKPPFPPPGEGLSVSAFREIWAYLVVGREEALKPGLPVTDIGYFGAEIDSYGKLSGVPDIENVPPFEGRIHLVVACNGWALTHFALIEGRPEREDLIRDLLEAAKPYHGLQIDFENVPSRDRDAFFSFLSELRAGLGNKIFSAALPARIGSAVYDYGKIKSVTDRILVMAYDEHWSGSEPGPVASMDWCRSIAEYALDIIGSEKLIMGLPFYGRSWGDKNANRAYVFSGIEEILRSENIGETGRENSVPVFKYETPLSVTVYYEDEYSLSARLEMYKNMEVNAVGFWRLGQETPAFWSVIAPESSSPP